MRSTYAPTSHGQFVPGHAPGTTGRVPAFDPEIANLFTELRRYLGAPAADIARHVATHQNVIAALEAGRIDLLPPWSETARVVTAYIALARLDPRPALERLAVLLGVAVPAPAASSPRVAHPVPSQAATPVSRILGRLSEAASRARAEAASAPGVWAEWVVHVQEMAAGIAHSARTQRAPVRWVAALAFALIVIGSVAPSGVLQASVGGISQPISGLWRKISGQATNVRVFVRGGLKWIEAEDPRARRADKLPSPRS